MQFGVVAVPLVCDTLLVRVAEKGFKLPSEPAKVFAVACPPVALLGRMTWIPVYNYAYVLAQQRFGGFSHPRGSRPSWSAVWRRRTSRILYSSRRICCCVMMEAARST